MIAITMAANIIIAPLTYGYPYGYTYGYPHVYPYVYPHGYTYIHMMHSRLLWCQNYPGESSRINPGSELYLNEHGQSKYARDMWVAPPCKG